MKNNDATLEEYARARLAFLTAGQPPLAPGPRRSAPAPGDHLDESSGVDEDNRARPGDDAGAAPRQPAGRTPGGWLPADDPPHPADVAVHPTGGPASLPARALGLARGHVAAVAIVLLAGLLATVGWLLRARAQEVPLGTVPGPDASVALPSSITTGTPPPAPRASATPTGPGATQRIEVHVLGAVRRPGVVRLPSGARVQDAVLAAGGLLSEAAPGELNLAAVVQDADQLVIGTRARPRGELRHGVAGTATTEGGAPATAAPVPGGTSSAPATTTVDLNTATAEQLDQLPGVGPVTAQRILEFRTQHQRFGRVEELQEVDGIGPKSYERIAPHVRV